MADRWMNERDREWRERDWRRSEALGRGYGREGEGFRGGEAQRRGEDRSWSDPAEHDVGPYGPARAMQEDQDYGRRSNLTTGGAPPQGYGRGGHTQAYQGGGSSRYGGELRFSSQDYTRGGYAEERGRDDDFDEPTRGYYPGAGEDDYRRAQAYGRERERMWSRDGDRSYNRDLERRHAEDLRQRASGGLGGYDYERGYGDAGRSERAGRAPWEAQRGPQREHEREHEHEHGEGPGDFLSRAGERISSWFRGETPMRGGRDDERDEARRRHDEYGRQERESERGARGLGPRGYRRSDDRINDEVHQRLTDDPWLDASEIGVEVKGGEVTLNGLVDNREAKHRAERLIENLAGVSHVQNNLRVKPDGGLTRAGRGFGSSALEAEMRRDAAATDPGNNGASGLSGRTSTGARAERSSGRTTDS